MDKKVYEKEVFVEIAETFDEVDRRVLLWTNPNPNATFASQTIALDLSTYDAIDVVFQHWVNNPCSTVWRAEKESVEYLASGISNTQSSSGLYRRAFRMKEDGVYFANGLSAATVENNSTIPRKIYGIQFGASAGDGSSGGTMNYPDLLHKPTINGVTLVEGLVTEDLNLGDTAHEEVTKAEFDALTDEKKNDGTVYFITDGLSGNVFLDDNVPVGTIAPFGGTTDPSYWLICDGRAVSRTDYASLFSVIGTTYGVGNGSTTFNIPDLRGNVAVGASQDYELGNSGGEDTHTLVENELPIIDGHLAWHGQEHGTHVYHVYDHFYGTQVASQYQTTGATAGAESWADVGYKFGGNQPHNNMQPYVVTNYIIKYDSTISRHQANIDFFYPVGSYYETSNADFNPNVTWGGTWVLENEGQVHVSAGGSYIIGATGGEVEHTLTISEMPRHRHPVSQSYDNTNYRAQSGGFIRFSTPAQTGGTGWMDANYSTLMDPVGGSQSHNNMQPYIVVNRWHRTA